jgi:hypothetical protein
MSKDDIISFHTIDLSKCEYGINIEETVKMKPANSSINCPGNLYIMYQITRPGQQIFNSEKFMVDKLTCYIEGIQNIAPQGTEY